MIRPSVVITLEDFATLYKFKKDGVRIVGSSMDTSAVTFYISPKGTIVFDYSYDSPSGQHFYVAKLFLVSSQAAFPCFLDHCREAGIFSRDPDESRCLELVQWAEKRVQTLPP